tara:strand:- start:19 stop:345 length:327 start_codon:yes stop_codon:yes gene_type:complete
MGSSIKIGDIFTSRGGASFTVTEDRGAKGFTITRNSTGKTVRISGSMIAKTLARAQAGECFAYQANSKQGGISYTVAIEAGVAYALRDVLKRDDANRQYVATSKEQEQ